MNRDRVALVDVWLKGGGRRRVTVFPPGRVVELPAVLADRDIRNWRNRPAALRATRFEAATSAGREMAKLEKDGLTRTQIAHRLGVSVSQVSRTLLRTGARQRVRKRGDDPWLMSWHAAGNPPGGRSRRRTPHRGRPRTRGAVMAVTE